MVINVADIAPLPDEDPDGFWDARNILRHIHDFAKHKRRSPWAVLGCVLIRTSAAIPAHVALPAEFGNPLSLNVTLALAGPSGSGKDSAMGAARQAIDFAGPGWEAPLYLPVGSGEGVARVFHVDRDATGDPVVDKDGVPAKPIARSAIFTASEIDKLAALMTRSGSTLDAVLRDLFTGGDLGFTNSGRDTRTHVPAGTYRACVYVGVQPGKAAPLLDGSGGTAQRILWAPTQDPDVDDKRPPCQKPAEVTRARGVLWPTEITLPVFVTAAMDAHQVAMNRGQVDGNDGHLLAIQAKVMTLLAVLDGRVSPNEDDWALAGQVVATSNATRAAVAQTVADQARQTNRAKAHAAADRETIIAARLEEEAQQRTAKIITRKLERVGAEGATRRDLLAACRSTLRDVFPTVFDLFIDKKFIVPVAGDGFAQRYRLNTDE
ncbi:hypothetical protein [Candidatus Mycolicibacterium alkanivorans]|uniref:DUF3987 domain-containing protein n=1 Tax=Candidatus Mycolicibacterium alkanivorans TaxID=2954114 RepID=A0ABS9YWT5_9MYCO|nr:hypothetical protein [Candidatus Mycolicibacterium alkanivorans]MCI4675289.1 hypothetical protein [Candidatus Mycolicibacterium alkanivorans]